jgi:hypothetical protein
MYQEKELCERIKSLYPDLGQCGIDMQVSYDGGKNVWVVDLKKDQHELKTYLDPADADTCMGGKQCVSLTLQISQLINNIKKV